MSIERALRGIAGTFIVLSLALSQLHSPYWLLFTLFVGLNLFQSSFTKWCPMMTFLGFLGLKSSETQADRTKDELHAGGTA